MIHAESQQANAASLERGASGDDRVGEHRVYSCLPPRSGTGVHVEFHNPQKPRSGTGTRDRSIEQIFSFILDYIVVEVLAVLFFTRDDAEALPRMRIDDISFHVVASRACRSEEFIEVVPALATRSHFRILKGREALVKGY